MCVVDGDVVDDDGAQQPCVLGTWYTTESHSHALFIHLFTPSASVSLASHVAGVLV